MEPNDDTRPFLPPAVQCNARLQRQDGYCTNPAGLGTKHYGRGRCSLHGGLSPQHDVADGPLDMWRAAGLGSIINMAETMSSEDQEYLFHVSNSALVIIRAGIVARMNSELVSGKELSDLSMALQRVDTLLAKYPDDEDPDAAPNAPDEREIDDFRRLEELEQQFQN